ncbi:MAG: SDR family oxidoreductase [Balneolaceae bacterium]|jgi:nucleoside-diphosphate-sugar epimerase
MKISILGCGWLGLPLAEHLLSEGHTVKGSTTSKEKFSLLKEKGIKPYLISLNPDLQCDDCDDFWEAEVLVLNIPPSRGGDNVIEFHLRQIAAVIEKIKRSPIRFVVFVSSTSVYPEKPGIVNEVDTQPGNAARDTGNALLEVEHMLFSQSEFQTTIIRFGGLYGRDRHPVKYLAGRENLDRGNAPVNLIHLDDCIAIIQKIIREGIKGEIFNAVSDGHPPKNMYYPAVAKALGLEPPTFIEDPGKGYKVVSNEKLRLFLNYNFKYPNPMDRVNLS